MLVLLSLGNVYSNPRSDICTVIEILMYDPVHTNYAIFSFFIHPVGLVKVILDSVRENALKAKLLAF